MNNATEIDTLEGIVERITYYNEENGYSVIRLAPSGQISMFGAVNREGLITVAGIMPQVTQGESLQIQGRWITHPEYGKQFEPEQVKMLPPTSEAGIIAFLQNFKGIGESRARHIVDHFGTDTLNVIDRDAERLYEVTGLPKKQAQRLINDWHKKKEDRETLVYLQGIGISMVYAQRIIETYGNTTVEKVQENPYQLATDIWGIGFKMADQIARQMGLEENHPQRIEAGIVYALNRATDDGNIYLPEMELVQQAAELLNTSPVETQAAIERAIQAEMIIIEDIPSDERKPLRGVYLPLHYRSEVGIARRLLHMIEHPTSHLSAFRQHNLAVLVKEAASEGQLSLSEQQQSAVVTALTEKVSILTGGPGTGKTTTLRALIDILERSGYKFALASPTGRAAKRLSETTGHPAKTIHRLLGFSPMQGFSSDEDNPLPVDFVIVDEVSMLDNVLANVLIRAIDPRSHLLLVGDVDQLPSVGAGDILRDLIASGVIRVTELDLIFRQEADSLIISNAHRINRGDMPIFPDTAQDFFLFNIGDDAQRAADLVVDIIKNRIPDRFNLHPLNDVQVLVPMYRGPAGVMELNRRLQEGLNPKGRQAERESVGQTFRVGDKVMQTRNNYNKDIFNGDVGRIYAINPTEQFLIVNFEERQVEYDWAELPELIHAYAVSVHRSQGSEYPAVVMPLLTQHYLLLQRNLLYTAVTRAKQLVVLVGSTKAIAMAVNNDAVSQRYTTLAARLREEL